MSAPTFTNPNDVRPRGAAAVEAAAAPGAVPHAGGLLSARAHTTLIPIARALTWRKRVGLFLGMFAVYLMAGSREPPWSDAKFIHGVAEAIAERGTVALPNGIPHAGKYYGMHPLLPSLVHVPGAYLHHKIASKYPTARGRSKAFTSHVGSAAVAALAVVIFVQLCIDLGASAGVAGFGGLVLGLATMLAIYARVAWSEIVQVACFLGFFRWLLRVADTPGRAAAIALGVWAGLLVNSKVVFMVSLPGAALFAAVKIFRLHGLATVARTAGWVVVGALPGIAMLLGYNLVRTGSVFNSGYAVPVDGAARPFGEALFYGLHGLFFSLGKSVFLYNPPLILGVLALPFVVWTTGRAWLWAALLTAGPPLLVYGRFVFWSGDWAWGPRYILYLVPLLLLPAVVLLSQLVEYSRLRARLAAAVAGGALLLGMGVQVVGGMIYWDHFIRLAQEVQHHWLGRPNRSGAISAVRPSNGRCDPCFEDFYAFNHLPALQPIEGHLWLARHHLQKHPWAVAEQDAPWRRYTVLSLPLQRHYAGARFDWWALDYLKGKRTRSAAWAIGAAGLLVMALGGWLWGPWRAPWRWRVRDRWRAAWAGSRVAADSKLR